MLSTSTDLRSPVENSHHRPTPHSNSIPTSGILNPSSPNPNTITPFPTYTASTFSTEIYFHLVTHNLY
jgi:hypothetical protein